MIVRHPGWLIAVTIAVAACSAGSPSPAGPGSQNPGSAAPPAATATPAPTTAATASASPASTPATGPTIFNVVAPDGTSTAFTLDALKALPSKSITSDGSPQEGPAVLDVIKAAGITTFSSVTFTGATGTRTMAAADVTADVILDFNNRGSVKLVSPTMSKSDRVIDITRIEAK
jgi:hypothetical protein